MKEVILLRHAKSDWATEFLKDIDRPLNERGYNDAYTLSQWFAKNVKHPDKLIISTATRAFSTAMIFARAIDLPLNKIELEPRIYESPANRLLTIISERNENENRMMMVGHNPGFSDLCQLISGGTGFDDIPTCALVHLSLDIHKWSEVKAGCGKVLVYQFPKNFKSQQ